MSKPLATTVVLNPAELIHGIVVLLRLDTLVAFATINRATRTSVQYHIASLISRELTPFFPARDARNMFWANLHNAGGVIAGALAFQLVRNSTLDETSPLDIILPHRKSYALRNLLVREGYQLELNIHPNRVDAGPCRRYALFKSKSTGRQVNVAETHGPSVLTCILGGSHTAFMNALTPTSIYSFYPSYTSSATTFGATHLPPDPVQFYRNMGLEFYPSVGDLSKPCGIACPQVYRRVRGSRGVLQFCWNDECSRDVFPLETHELDWRLGSICDNEMCTYY